MLKNFKPSEFLHVLRKIERSLREAVVELRAIRKLLEPGTLEEDYFITTGTWDCLCEKDDDG